MNNNFRNPPKGFTAPPPNPSKIFNIVSITFNDQLCFRYIQNVYGHFVIGATAQAGQRNVVLLHIVPVTDGYNQNGDTEVYILFSFVYFLSLNIIQKNFCTTQNLAPQCPADSTTWCLNSYIAQSCNVSFRDFR